MADARQETLREVIELLVRESREIAAQFPGSSAAGVLDSAASLVRDELGFTGIDPRK